MTTQRAIRLVVPRSDERVAEALGMFWDASARAWFAPATLPRAAYAAWLPPTPAENLRADRFWMARADGVCPACTAAMHVFCLLLPTGHQSQDDPWSPWVSSESGARIYYLVHLNQLAAERVHDIAPGYRQVSVQSHPRAIWQNHCPHCQSVNPDHTLHVDSTGVFVPRHGDNRKFMLYPIDQPFVGHARGYAWGVSVAAASKKVA